MKTYKIKSYAKINLYLEVLKKRRDGYHEITTLFEKVDLSDEIYLKPASGKTIKIISDSPGMPKGRTNLAFRAASLLRKDLSINSGVEIRINKRIPLASGLAGGSSNAASVLLGLNKLWKLNLGSKKLISYARMLGCDVPFFLSQASFAIGEGRGDDIKIVKGIKKRFWHVLAIPKIKVSTRKVYARWDKIFAAASCCWRGNSKGTDRQYSRLTKSITNVKMLIQALKQGKIPLIREHLFNQLEMVTFDLYPQLNQLKNILLDLGVKAILMSGSGPAMFGIVSSRKEASVLCKQLSRFKKYDTFIAKTL